ncbi:MAG TPA: glycosyltransferase [Roseiflexaceae bacterium]|nr:glycosyltransferase [Roseiflexaceae bacterium]
MTPLVSIVIPNYNCAPFLRLAVESALAQSYPAIEVIVVDDGSTDTSTATIEDLVAAGRVRLIKRENGGVATARNTGLAACHGTYVVFLDCDDLLHPDMVATLMPLIDRSDHMVFAYGDYLHIDAAGEVLPENHSLRSYRSILDGNILPSLLIGAYLLPLCILFSRRSIEEIGGFAAQYSAADDYHLLLRLVCAGGRAHYTEQVVAFYRHRPGSQSADLARMHALEAQVLQTICAAYTPQITAVLPQLLTEIRMSAKLAWQVSHEHLQRAQQYAGTLEQQLATIQAAGPSSMPRLRISDEIDPALTRIIIPCYNQAPFLRIAVESALAQQDALVEVIVIDDGSTDASSATIADLTAAGQVRLITQPNQGLSAARNAGIAAARGAYLVLLDADDLLAPTMVARLRPLVDPADPLIFAYCDRQLIDANGTTLPTEHPIGQMRLQLEGNLLAPLLAGNYIQPNCLLISRELVAAVGGFDTSLPLVEDYDLLLRFCIHGASARFLDQPLASYRRHAGNLSRQVTAMQQQTTFVQQQICRRYPLPAAQALPQVIAEIWHHYNLAWRSGQEQLALASDYAASLRAELTARDDAMHQAISYARSLETAIAGHEAALAEAAAYARSLEAALHEAISYARSLEAERAAGKA